jgi:small subunit ribosomal protein S4
MTPVRKPNACRALAGPESIRPRSALHVAGFDAEVICSVREGGKQLMGRYRGPVEKLSRREGTQLSLRGERVLAGRSAIERRGYSPGQHGHARRRVSEHRLQLREKQKAKCFYGLREGQFRNLFGKASRGPGTPGEILLRLLELRLDNVAYRLGLASTRAQARQLVVHGHIRVNGEKGRRALLPAEARDVVTLVPGARVEPVVRRATDLTAIVPPWLEADHEQLSGTVLACRSATRSTRPSTRS